MAPSGSPSIGPAVRRYVTGVSLLAALSLVAGLVALQRAPPPLGWREAAGLAFFTGAFVFLERRAVPFRWRGHQTNLSLAEAAIYLGLAFLPLVPLLFLIPGGILIMEAARKHKRIKVTFNVAVSALSAFAGIATAGLLVDADAPVGAAAVVGTLGSSFTGDILMAGLFAQLGGEGFLRTYRERFARSTAFTLAYAIPVGVVLHGLFVLHPVTVLAALPLGFLVLRQSELQGRADRELDTHRHLAEVSHNLLGSRDHDRIAARVLDACASVLDAGSVRLQLAGGATWEREGEGPDPRPGRALVEPLRGRDGALLGHLTASPRAGKAPWGEMERALLRLVAGTAAHALKAAAVLEEVAAQRDLIARQEKLSALGTLMAGVAHEINNPLSFMRLRVASARKRTEDVLKAAAPSADAHTYATGVAESLESLERGLDRLADLSHSLKVAARPGTGERAALDLNAVAEEVLPIVRAGFSTIRWETRLHPDLPPVLANESELHQVLLNLLKNAAEALNGHPEGRIRVETRVAGGLVELHVEDNGPGVPEAKRDDLFRPFYTTKKSGTGLGLSISAEILAAHGGSLTYEPTTDGGSVFVMRVPLVA